METRSLKLETGRSCYDYNLSEEPIVVYMLKKARQTSPTNVNLLRTSDGKVNFLKWMQNMTAKSGKLLPLGEPDYVEVYLKYFPILTSPYLLDGDGQSEGTPTEAAPQNTDKDLKRNLGQKATGHLCAIPEEEDTMSCQTEFVAKDCIKARSQAETNSSADFDDEYISIAASLLSDKS